MATAEVVITAEPFVVPGQSLSSTSTSVYVPGSDTVIVCGLSVVVIVTGVVPSVYVNVQGPVPVKVTVMSTVVPLFGQIAPDPAIVASGGGIEITSMVSIT